MMSNSTLTVIGTQWGDEGKGKVVDLLAEGFDVVARYQGGNNAGHTVYANGGKKYVMHLVPSGILQGKTCILGNGMVINPGAFFQELDMLTQMGVETQGKLFVSSAAHLVAPWHMAIDQAHQNGIGTTNRGIGPAYADKAGRIGIRAGLVHYPKQFEEAVQKSWEAAAKWLDPISQLTQTLSDFIRNAMQMAPYVCNTVAMLHSYLAAGKHLLIEGAQGTELDIDHGNYPFVTSSSTIAGGACTGLGLPPNQIGTVVGVMKAYVTRVGGGPLVTEMDNEAANVVVHAGQEFGASTGRQRRPGWLDLFQLKHACTVSGVKALVLTKGDVLDGFQTVWLCTGYRCQGEHLQNYPDMAHLLEMCEPVYTVVPGWQRIAGTTKESDLPGNFRRFVERIEEELGIPVVLISTGPEREQNVIRGGCEQLTNLMNSLTASTTA